jgi:ATPase, YjeE family
MIFKSKSAVQTEQFASEFAKGLKSGDFIAFYGELGSGKTAFVRGLAKALCPDARISSPTYAIVNEYIGQPSIFHFDMYRISDDDSLYSTGFYDYFDRDGIIAVEWCENIPFGLPKHYYKVVFHKGIVEDERIITIDRIEEK